MTDSKDRSASEAARKLANLRDEIDGGALYRALSEAESDPKMKEVYARLAGIEDAHADFWRRSLGRRAADLDKLGPSARTRALIWLARRFGPSVVAPTIAGLERRDSSKYDQQPDAVAAGLARDERSHARLLTQIANPADGLTGPAIAKLEGRHRGAGGNALRAAVLGANDGLLSNLSLVMGVAGAATDNRTILITGLAGLIAGACSMALGEWLSVTSSRELFARQIATEKAELEANPADEAEELALIYEAKGLPAEQARAFAERLMSDHTVALDTLAREELGIDPEELGGSAVVAGATSFLLFAGGAAFPVLPFFFLSGSAAVLSGVALSISALAFVGAATSLFTGRGIAFSAIRQVAIGAIAAGTTFAIGKLLGASIP